MNQVRHLPSLRMVLVSSLLSAIFAVVGVSLASEHVVELATVTTQVEPAQARTYEVQHGDTLSLIAARELGSTERWRDLFAANRDRLRKPSELEIGTTLRLP